MSDRFDQETKINNSIKKFILKSNKALLIT